MKAGAWTGVVVAVGLLVSAGICRAAIYPGLGSTSPNDTVSGGSLQITDSGNNVNLSFTRGTTTFADALIFYFDSVPGAGFNSTSGFTDHSGTAPSIISGIGQYGSSTANFASGFGADYALVLELGTPLHSLYRLSGGGDGSMELIRSVALDGQPSSSQFNTSFSWSDLGITSTDSRGFRFQSTYITMSGSRYLESFENLTPNSQRGFGTVWFSDYNLYGVDPVPEPTNIALAIFGGLAITGTAAARARRWWTERRSATA